MNERKEVTVEGARRWKWNSSQRKDETGLDPSQKGFPLSKSLGTRTEDHISNDSKKKIDMSGSRESIENGREIGDKVEVIKGGDAEMIVSMVVSYQNG